MSALFDASIPAPPVLSKTPRCDALAKGASPDWEKAARELEVELSHAYLLVAQNIEGSFLACDTCRRALDMREDGGAK